MIDFKQYNITASYKGNRYELHSYLNAKQIQDLPKSEYPDPKWAFEFRNPYDDMDYTTICYSDSAVEAIKAIQALGGIVYKQPKPVLLLPEDLQ